MLDLPIVDAIRQALNYDIQQFDLQKVPLLAHYTSMDSLEKIMMSNELWFSNPLLMNDHEEVHWGITQCATAIEQSPMLKATLADRERYKTFIECFRAEIRHYAENHLFDTYVFCLSAHTLGDDDGLLSMWRGYGGDGRGAAIIFDPKSLNQAEGSPLIIDQVAYRSNEQRAAWALALVSIVNAILQTHDIPDGELRILAALVFQRVKLAALFSKHIGFSEEREWRVVYMPERDTAEAWKRFFGYTNGSRGLEPKFKFEVKPLAGVTADDLSLEKIVSRIVIGPHRASSLVEGSAKRMLLKWNKPKLASTLKSSGIPYRSFG